MLIWSIFNISEHWETLGGLTCWRWVVWAAVDGQLCSQGLWRESKPESVGWKPTEVAMCLVLNGCFSCKEGAGSLSLWQKVTARGPLGPRPSLFQQIVSSSLTSKGACALVGSPRLWLGRKKHWPSARDTGAQRRVVIPITMRRPVKKIEKSNLFEYFDVFDYSPWFANAKYAQRCVLPPLLARANRSFATGFAWMNLLRGRGLSSFERWSTDGQSQLRLRLDPMARRCLANALRAKLQVGYLWMVRGKPSVPLSIEGQLDMSL